LQVPSLHQEVPYLSERDPSSRSSSWCDGRSNDGGRSNENSGSGRSVNNSLGGSIEDLVFKLVVDIWIICVAEYLEKAVGRTIHSRVRGFGGACGHPSQNRTNPILRGTWGYGE
jgi:hypothetical protein